MSDEDDFFKNAKNVKYDNEEEDDINDQFKKYYNLHEEKHEDIEEEHEDIEEEHEKFRNKMFGSFDYNQFMNQSSSEYMMYSTMDLLKTMNIMTELRQLFSSLSDWDRVVIYYAYELMQRNMQLAYKLVLYLFKTQNEELVSQMIYWGLLLFCLSNVQTAYSYLIYRVYKLDKAFARKLHEYLKEQFMFFENSDEMCGSFTNNIKNRLDHPQGGRYSRIGNVNIT